MPATNPTLLPHVRRFAILLLVLAGALTLSGCEAIAAIFRAGVWVGVLGVLLLVLLIWLLVRLFR